MRALRLTVSALALAVLAALAACASPQAAETPADPEPVESQPIEPELSAEDMARLRAAEIVDGMSVRERVSSVIMGTAPGVDAAALRAYVADNGLGGFILMSSNVPGDPASLRAITDQLVLDPEFPPLIAIDQEGGEVSRIPWDPNPGANELKFLEPAQTTAAFGARAALLGEAGVNVNFGIVADVPSGEGTFIYGRALGADAVESAARVSAAVEGERGAVFSTLKHFPGHGAAEGDSHFGVPGTALGFDDWRASHALPFAAGIDAGAELLMFGHLAYSAVDEAPASLSAEWHRIAREELGFSGVAVSDDLGMLLSSGVPEYQSLVGVVIRALVSGADLALVIQGVDGSTMPALIDGIAAAVESGVLPEERLDEAAERVAELRLEAGWDAL